MNLRLASIFENLARFEEADKHATEARNALDQLNAQGLPIDTIDAQERRVLDADITYQFASHHMGRADYAQALPILKEALQKNLACRGEKEPLVAEIHEYIGLSYHGLGQMNEAIEALETASRLCKEMNPDHLEKRLLTMTITLAQIYQTVGNPVQSVAKLEEAKGFLKQLDLGDKDPLRISALHNVALVHMRHQEPERAAPMLEECLALVEEVFGDDHLRAAKTQHSLAACYTLLGRHEDALPLYQSSWERQVEIAGEGNEWSLIFLRDLTQCVANLGKREDWIRYLDRLIDLTRTHLGDNHYLMDFAMKQYARLWEGDPTKLSELEKRLSGEEAWPSDRAEVLLAKGSP
jgi:tetratricopeptide (TPR) repeat protein